MTAQPLTPEETGAQAKAMIEFLHQALSEANARIANLAGEKAVLEVRLAGAGKKRKPQNA